MKTITAKAAIIAAVTACIATGIACGEARSAGEGTANSALAATSSVNLITEENCIKKVGRLTSCIIPDQTLTGQDLDTAVPVRTVLSINKSGNCSTQYPLEITLETPDELPVKLQYLSQPKVVVRRRDGLPISFIALKDSSPWTKTPLFDVSCHVTAAISSNEIDVDTKEQAQAIIDRLTKDLAEKTEIRNRYGDLVEFQKAFAFLQSVTTYFYIELTNDRIQQLRAESQVAKPVMMKLITDKTCGALLSDAEFTNVVDLFESMAVLGTPDVWKGPDGKSKSLADIIREKISADAAKVLETVIKISQEHDSDAGTGYEDGYKRAALDVERAKAKLALAKTQLARWLAQ